MSLLDGIPPELLVLPPLALAAGVDLYLTLLSSGPLPGPGWWDTLPGALGDLGAPGVVLIVGSFYLLEFLAEAWPSAALFWNAFHAIIRPLAGALLALLLLDGQSASVVVPGAVAGRPARIGRPRGPHRRRSAPLARRRRATPAGCSSRSSRTCPSWGWSSSRSTRRASRSACPSW